MEGIGKGFCIWGAGFGVLRFGYGSFFDEGEEFGWW